VMTLGPRVAPRKPLDRAGTSITVPPGRWRDVLSGAAHDGGCLSLGCVWNDFPVALLERVDA
jgi:(1->4)-alpha-D-glucan 1-alpha-D-glucosylmutase